MNSSTHKPITALHIFSGDLWAGAEVMVFNLLRKLKDSPDLKILALSLNEGILTQKLRENAIETYVIPESDFSFAKLLFKAFRLLRKKQIDIIHSHRYKENLMAFLLAKPLGVRSLITTMHGLAEPLFEGEKGKIPSGAKIKMDHFLINHFFSRIVAVSQVMKTTLVNKYHFTPKTIEVIYNGIPAVSLNPCLKPNGSFHIGTVGRMVPVKDYDLFLKVASHIRKQNVRARFSILGEGPLKDHLKNEAKVLGIDDCIEFRTPVSDPFPYYNSLDIYMNTSFHEGLPLSILEAMACGVPVIAPSVGGIPEIITNQGDGVLINNRNPIEYKDMCLKLLADGELRTRLVQNAQCRIKTIFSDSAMAQSYNNLYQNA